MKWVSDRVKWVSDRVKWVSDRVKWASDGVKWASDGVKWVSDRVKWASGRVKCSSDGVKWASNSLEIHLTDLFADNSNSLSHTNSTLKAIIVYFLDFLFLTIKSKHIFTANRIFSTEHTDWNFNVNQCLIQCFQWKHLKIHW